MTERTTTLKQETIDAIVGRVQERFEGDRAAAAERFIRHYYEDIAPEDIVGTDPADLYGSALSLWQLGAQRRPGEVKIRVFNPRVEKHGWHSPHTVIEIVHDDMPFLVDSVTMALSSRGLTVHLFVHPQFAAQRTADGELLALAPRGEIGDGAIPESYMHIDIDERGAVGALREIEDQLKAVLADVRAAVTDWRQMIEQAESLTAELGSTPPPRAEPAQLAESIEFLRWLLDDNFTFLGYREMDIEGKGKGARIKVRPETCLGLLGDPEISVFQGLRELGRLPLEVQAYLRQSEVLVLTKANRRSTVHRPVLMDVIVVKRFDEKGVVTGVRLFVGLFTSAAYNQSPRNIPLLRQKIAELIRRADYDPASHAGKALVHILDSYPRDELFQTGLDDLYDITRGIVQLQERQRTALFLRRDPFERFISAFVFVPRDRYNTRLRLTIERILGSALGGRVVNWYTHMSDDVLSRVHFIVETTPGKIPDYDREEIEARLVEAGRSWEDRLKHALVETMGEEAGLQTFGRYDGAFPVAYTEEFSAHTAVYDIGCIDRALSSGELGMNLYHPIEAGANELQFKIYQPGAPVPLSDVLPMLENMGLKVLGEVPYHVQLAATERPLWLHDFSLVSRDGGAIDFESVREPFHDSFARIWRGEVEDDGFNRLVLSARLGWREVLVLKAYSKYLRQIGIPFSQAYMEETLARNGAVTRLLAELFEVRFKPDFSGDADKLTAELLRDLFDRLESVESLDEDRIIRRFVNVIGATVRTNFFQAGPDGESKPHLALKLDARRIDELPEPRPFREIFVYSPRIEGVHLRFGAVARGGLRWSDRREDFRTEILGLVKAQQVKNAVIVPVGSKGGFVCKQLPPPGDREAYLAEGVACYKTFISGLLDLTDNRVGDDVVPPPDVVRKDPDDPYLVVAADKGTATFSDIANGVAQDYEFWLDDAFASGGSAGYDHKKMGITARGAWESVKRHFREMDHDTQSEDFTVVGVGDMAGDVFGNGMLLSEHIRLIGAFNHLHVFIDPDPDAKASFAERRRLFEMPRSSWADYDPKLISKGGGVFERRAKAIRVSKQMKALFDIDADSLTPAELIQAMLRARVDLLWFGGIGTYVKSSRETDAAVGDHANDALRVDADELGCKVIGEGANLGVTQLGRVEFALRGGRINTDAIDNSAGVDTSDHEVNIKILMGDLMARKKLTREKRDTLLGQMTDEVAVLVLRNNYQQTQSLSVVQYQGIERMDEQLRLIKALERAGRLNREIEFLPDEETFAERRTEGRPLTRPELAVLLAYAKIATYDELLASDLPDDPVFEADLARYFPQPIQGKYADAIGRHRLRREIVATSLTNSIINRTGPAFINEMRLNTGMDVPAIARAYTISREVFDLHALWHDIEALDTIAPATSQTGMLLQTVYTLWRITPWFLRNCAHPLDITSLIAEFHEGVQRLAAALDDILAPEQQRDTRERAKSFEQLGVPGNLAARIGRLKALSSAPDIVRIASAAGQGVEEAGTAYFLIGDRFRLDWLRHTARTMSADTQWQRLALGAIIDDVWSHQYDLTTAALRSGKAGVEAVEGWAAAHVESVERIGVILNEIQSAPTPDLAMLAVVNRELRTLAAL
ncbi:MAG: NAD-glutamate dehydrogenase [Rhodospirillales bacterium]|nr:MAG: NAD-glutamate dehydrogenase [Rhodospirillales bacterium]